MRDIPVGNGSLLVTFDEKYQIRDVYFPHVGQENHSEGFPFHFGVWVDGEFSWIFSDDWQRELKYLPETLVTDVRLVNENLGLEIRCNDTVLSHENVFLRRVRVCNLREEPREVRVFMHHDFRIYENKVGDTAYYDPETLSLIHYKKHRYFLINTEPHFDSFSTGRKAFRDKEGTWRDAEDGKLENGVITEGSVDSTIQNNLAINPKETEEFYYWIAAGTSHKEAFNLNEYVHDATPKKCLDYTENYWRIWVNKNEKDFDGLSDEVVELYKRSLLVIRTQFDNGGAFIAANDSDVTERATDHYSYLWTRDGAFIANALDLAGYPHFTRKFFRLCGKIVHEKDGYFLQKYNPDGTVASGWHAAWDVWSKRKLLPIQEDETALVLWALWQHYDKYREMEFSRNLYRPLIKKCANFLADFVDENLNLPKASWNLWEDRRGIHTYTCCTVVAGLRASANFARLFGETDKTDRFERVADKITAAMKEHLYSEENGRFLRALNSNNGNFEPDPTIDASLFALFYFDVFDAEDELVKNTMSAIEEKLWVDGVGGVARFENDGYMRVADEFAGNPWFLCTLWLAEYRIAIAKTKADLKGVLELLEWTAENALSSGVLAEQVSPLDGSPVSVSPLTWSHSTFVAVVENYLEKLKELE